MKTLNFILVFSTLIFYGSILHSQCPTGTPILLPTGSLITVGPNQLSGQWGAVSTSQSTCGGNKFSYSDIYQVTYQPGMSIFLDHWWSQYQNAEVYMEILDASHAGCPTVICNYLINNGVGSIVGTSFSQNPVGMNNSIASITTSLDEIGLTPGQTVYIKILTDKKTSGITIDNTASGYGVYSIGAFILPANSCTNQVYMIGDSTYTIDNQYASDSYSNLDYEGAGCGYSIENNLMFKWCTDEDNTPVEIIISDITIHDPTVGSMQFAILQGACGGPYTTLQCNSGIAFPQTILINDANTSANQCYWIMLDGNAGTWWTLDLELHNAVPVILSVELVDFEIINREAFNEIKWTTISETNNDYFEIDRSNDGHSWSSIAKIESIQNSRVEINYKYEDQEFKANSINYYRLKQTDLNGVETTLGIKAVINAKETISHRYNSMGQEVDENYDGLVFIQYSSGRMIKTIQSGN